LPLTEFADGGPLAGAAELAIGRVNTLGMRLDPNMERSAAAISMPYPYNTASPQIRVQWAAGRTCAAFGMSIRRIELTLHRSRSGDVIFGVRNARSEIGGEHVAPRNPNGVDER
jgi:hypothetical protein